MRIVGAILGILFSFSALAGPKEPLKLKLALNWKAEPEFGGFYEAKLGGAFQRKGLDVEILEGGAGTPIVQMIATGQADFGIAAADEVVISQERGTDVLALFAVYQTNPQGIMVHPAKNFKNIGELFASPGTLAIQAGAPTTLFLKNKYPGAKLKTVPYLGGVGNFLNDESFSQQCFITSEPLAVRKKGKLSQTFLIAEAGFNPYATVVVARKSALDRDPVAAQAFVQAVREGWSSYLKSPERANLWMAKLNPTMDLATFREVSEVQKPFILGQTFEKFESQPKVTLGKMTSERWKILEDQLFQLRLIKKLPPVAGLFRDL